MSIAVPVPTGPSYGGGDVRVAHTGNTPCSTCNVVLWSTAVALSRAKNSERGTHYWPNYEYNAEVSHVNGINVCDSPPCKCGKNRCECESWASAMRASKWWCPRNSSNIPVNSCGCDNCWFPLSSPTFDAMANFYSFYDGSYLF